MIVYKTTNLINNKIYIGKDTHDNPNYLGSGIVLKRAIKKYGKLNFLKETIEKCVDENHVNEREIYWISYYRSISANCIYNIATGGEGGDNLTYNPNRDKILAKQKENAPRGVNHCYYGKKSPSSGIKWTDEQKATLKLAMLNSEKFQKVVHSKERAEKISKAQKGIPKSKEFVEKYLIGKNNPMYGKEKSPETLNKLKNSLKNSEAFKIAMKSKERSEKISKFQKGKIISEETKEKLRGNKNGMYGKTHTEENKKKMSFPMELNPRARKVIIVNKIDNTIKEFGCVTLAAKYLNIARTTAGQYAKCEKEITPGIIIKYK